MANVIAQPGTKEGLDKIMNNLFQKSYPDLKPRSNQAGFNLNYDQMVFNNLHQK